MNGARRLRFLRQSLIADWCALRRFLARTPSKRHPVLRAGQSNQRAAAAALLRFV